MKNLIIVNGTMGVGKTATCQELRYLLPNNVFLDGDWCWMMQPFLVNEETKTMAMDNITHMLNNFLKCSTLENIIFCWVIHQTQILQQICEGIDTSLCTLHVFTLTCTPQELTQRIMKDVEQGTREEQVLGKSLERLVLYEQMPTYKIDVSQISPQQSAQRILDEFKARQYR